MILEQISSQEGGLGSRKNCVIRPNRSHLRDPLILGRTGRKEICVNPLIENRRPKGKPNLWDIDNPSDVLKTGNTLAISDISLIFAPSLKK